MAVNRSNSHLFCRSRINLIFTLIALIVMQLSFSSCERIPDPLFASSVIKGAATTDSGRHDSILVVANGPYGRKSVYNDETGYYEITGLGNGTYRLDFIKEGYGTLKQYGLQLFGNDTIQARRVTLYSTYSDYILPDFKGISLGLKPRLYATDTCVIIATNQKEGPFPILFFLSTYKSVSYLNYQVFCSNYDIYGPFEEIKDYKIYIELKTLPFESGSEIFVIGYVCNLGEDRSGCFNKYLGREEWSTLEPEKHTPLMSFIMP